MSRSRETEEYIHRWIKKAENDRRNAEHTLTLQKDCPFDTVCYHAQQCAEKYLKALLLYEGIVPPRIHDLAELRDLYPSAEELEEEIKDYEELILFAVEVKYPGRLDDPTREEAEKAVDLADKFRIAIRKRLKDILNE